MQMNRYILTSIHYTGGVQFNYDNEGLLVFYSVLDADLTKTQLVTLLKKLPREEWDLAALNETKYFTIKKLDEDLSFENFWAQYDKKIHPNRCEPLWKKLSEVKRLAALKSIGAYDAYLRRTGVAKCNPQNYIIREYWKTNWSKE
jgi:hypothetical protein